MRKSLISPQLRIGAHEHLARRLADAVNNLDDQVAVARFLAAQSLDRPIRTHKAKIWARAKILRLENGPLRKSGATNPLE
jgi:hypothetical protein